VIEEFRANQGKIGGAMKEMPIVLITMTGAKTGRALTRPLCYSCDGDRIVIIASYGGAPKNPPWYHNLVKNPVVTVEVGTEKYQARAVQVSGAERKRLFPDDVDWTVVDAAWHRQAAAAIPDFEKAVSLYDSPGTECALGRGYVYARPLPLMRMNIDYSFPFGVSTFRLKSSIASELKRQSEPIRKAGRSPRLSAR
jgi:deazaflavin-dependent oxidoreductase (nitroreductase family)